MPATSAATGTLNFTDVDVSDTGHTANGDRRRDRRQRRQPEPSPSSTRCSSTVVTNTAAAADGTIDWTFDASEALFDYLNNGESIEMTYTVVVTDDDGATNSETVTITITGANDAPVIAAAASGQSDALSENAADDVTPAQDAPVPARSISPTSISAIRQWRHRRRRPPT